VTTKATALRGLSAAIAPLVDEHTAVAFLQNGMAWWYPLGLPAGRPAPASLHVFGLADEYLRLLRPEQVLGGVVYSANAVVRPGLVRNNSPAKNAVELGCIDDLERPALLQARRALVQAGIESPPVADIRSALWLKLVGNAATSSLCVAIGNPAALLTDTALQQVYENLLRECLAVAAAHGHDVADRVGATNWTPHRARHKPSLLQDYEAGRPMEVEELLLAPVAFARAAGVATPTLDAVTAIAARLAIDKGLFRP
ncbi:MAG TPA: ketopantoate reductase C-terminal domain-containing protein, partial [Ramlibacter sp.]|nr:ketopantoate reductase C-terminal domain-containing protein [Ramlibacter sp.]